MDNSCQSSSAKAIGSKLIQGKVKGVAILMVLVGLALFAAIVTQISTQETVKYKLALNERDTLKAEALAQSGANFAQLILMVQEPLQGFLNNFAQAGLTLPSYTVWNILPIDSELLINFSKGNLFAAEDSKEKKEEEKKIKLYGKYEIPEGGYGAFDGNFLVKIKSEEERISLRKFASNTLLPPQKKLIYDQIVMILSQEKYKKYFDGSYENSDNININQLVGFIYDYITDGDVAVDVNAAEQNWGRDGNANKKAFYTNMDGILPKRARMDSISELRLIPTMTDAVYSILEKHLTIYGETDAINMLACDDDVLKAIFYSCTKNRESTLAQNDLIDKLLLDWNKKKSEGQAQMSVEGLMKHLEENKLEPDSELCKKIAGNESKNFTIESTAKVGNITKTLLVRLRSAGGTSTIYQFQYL